MTRIVNIHEAKTHLSKLLARVSVGEEIIIAKAGRPVARLTPLEDAPVVRIAGSAVGEVVLMPDFDAPLPDDVIEAFEQ
jgi:prevent-host-death family protein